MNKIDLGNHEALAAGIIRENNGTFTAVTWTESKNFKTAAGAKRWLAKRGHQVQWPEL